METKNPQLSGFRVLRWTSKSLKVVGKEPPDKLSVCIAEYNNCAVNTLSCPHSCPLVGWVDHT